MEEYLSGFTEYISTEKRMSANTVVSYLRDIRHLLNYLENHQIKNPKDITPTHLTGYVLKMEAEKKAPSTVSRAIASIKSFFYYLMREKIIDNNPAERLEPPKVIKALPEILSESEMDKLLDLPDTKTPKGKRDKAMLEVLYATGLRASEIVVLELEQVNLTLKYVKCCCRNKMRIIPIGKKAVEALESYLRDARKLFISTTDCEYFFVNCNGGQMTRQGFWKIIKEYARQCSFEQRITPNIFRHSFAAHMVARGADLHAVQEMMGHSDISTTQIYVQMHESHLNEVYRNTHPRAR